MSTGKTEKTVGYILLVIGLIFIILPASLALIIFLNKVQVPQLIPNPTEETDGFSKSFAIFSNICLIFFIFIAMIWAGAIISNRGLTLIKEIKEVREFKEVKLQLPK